MGSSDFKGVEPPRSVLSKLSSKKIDELLCPEKKAARDFKRHRELYLAVKRWFKHEQEACKECDYGVYGHCLIIEKRRLRVFKLLKTIERESK